ncbi:MAG: T9SS type A sorting domain-containing protein [Ignavibacteria bacterium]|nr:T9SS type A sorting domain-containing protein [Ignavibacteria bacterium]
MEKNKFINKISSLLFYISILTFIIAFNFAHNPPGGWYQQSLPNINGASIRDMTFTDSLNGYIVTSIGGSNSYILKTTNGGDNWDLKFTHNQPFVKVQFINANTGFTNAFTKIFKTTNAGENWNAINLPQIFGDDMSVLNEDTVWLAMSEGFTGGVFRTTNGGLNWIQQYSAGSQNPDKIYMFNPRIGFIVRNTSGAPNLRKTTNGGFNWFNVLNEGFVDMYFIDSLKGWRAYGNNMYLTTNGGSNWVVQILPSGGIILSTGINEFSNINSDTIFGAGGIAFYGSGQFRSIIYKTFNGGKNWFYQVPDTAIHSGTYQHIQFSDRLKGWAYWVSGGIHTLSGGDTAWLTNIKNTNTQIADNFILHQNYPNPFNPLTKIKYELKTPGFIKLNVYNINGKEVKTIVNEKQNTGVYEADFSATEYGSSLSSGVYFYSLFAGEELVDTKKMIVLK